MWPLELLCCTSLCPPGLIWCLFLVNQGAFLLHFGAVELTSLVGEWPTWDPQEIAVWCSLLSCCSGMWWRRSELEIDGHMDLGSVIFTFRCAHVHLSCSLNDSELDQNFSFSQIIKKLGESWLHHKIFRTVQSCVNYNNWAIRKPEDQVKWNTPRWGCSCSTFHVVVNLNNWNSWGLMFCVV